MRFLDMQKELRHWMGKPDNNALTNALLQEIRDCLNQSMDFIKQQAPFWWNDVETQDISVVAGTALYDLSDWTYVPLDYWVEGDVPHHLQYLSPHRVDMLGLRGTNMQEGTYGPYKFTFAPSRKTSTLSGTCDVTEGGTTVTNGSGTFTTAMSGKRIRFNGEEEDYVFTRTSNTAGTIDRAYRSRRPKAGTDANSLASAYNPTLTGIAFDISPGPVWQAEFRPTPTAAITVKLRYLKRWARMINDNDVPTNMEERHHHMLLDCAKMKLIRHYGSGAQERQTEYQTLKEAFVAALEACKAGDDPMAQPGRVMVQPLWNDYAQTGGSRQYPVDQNWRGGE